MTQTIEVFMVGAEDPVEYRVTLQNANMDEVYGSEILLPQENQRSLSFTDGAVIADYEDDTEFEVNITEGEIYKSVEIEVV